MTEKKYEGLFDTGFLVKKAKALDHLKRVLLHEKKGFYNVLFKRIGAHNGLSEGQFDVLVQLLEGHQFCTRSVGERGAVTITLISECDQI